MYFHIIHFFWARNVHSVTANRHISLRSRFANQQFDWKSNDYLYQIAINLYQKREAIKDLLLMRLSKPQKQGSTDTL
jgi:hypothetical protein